jgi:hypothetical protein
MRTSSTIEDIFNLKYFHITEILNNGMLEY